MGDQRRWGPLKGAFLHTSYGASSLYLVMPEIVNEKLQGATYKFPLKFASGIMRARFNPKDGQLYVCGLKDGRRMACATEHSSAFAIP